MRPITKIFLLIVVAFVVYLLWPRSGSVKGFDAAKMATLQVQEWQAEKAGKPGAAFWTRFKIYTSQYNISPVAAFRMAQSEGGAISKMKPSVDEADAEISIDPSIVLGFTEKYALMKRQVNGTFDSEAMAHAEYTWRSLLFDKVPADQMTSSVTDLLMGFYGGVPTDFADVAANIVNAQGYVFGNVQPTDGTDPAAAANTAAADGYKLLKEIAEAPAPAAPAEN